MTALSAEKPRATARSAILIVDDHPLFRRGIAAIIEEQPDLALCCEAENLEAALEEVRQHKPDVAIVDVSLPGPSGLDLVARMRAEQPKVEVLVMSMHDELIYAIRALRAGAKGYLLKTEAMENLVTALRQVIAGGVYVTPAFRKRFAAAGRDATGAAVASPIDKLSGRECEVFHLFGRGFGTREVAKELNLSVKTVETHRSHIQEKLRVTGCDAFMQCAIDRVSLQQG